MKLADVDKTLRMKKLAGDKFADEAACG
jgi:hypothetical protein